jgi:hypothetical protein
MENRLRWFYILPLLVLIFALPLSAGAVGPRVVLQETNGDGASEIPGDGSTVDFTLTGDAKVNVEQGTGNQVDPGFGSGHAICVATNASPILTATPPIGNVISRVESPRFHLNNVRAGHPTTAPNKITVQFDVRYSTHESTGLHTDVSACQGGLCFRDLFVARLLTAAGPYPILVIDPTGVQPQVKGSQTTVTGFTGFGAGETVDTFFIVDNGTGTLHVMAVLVLSAADQTTILANDLAALHFTISNEDDTAGASLACMKNIEVDAQP